MPRSTKVEAIIQLQDLFSQKAVKIQMEAAKVSSSMTKMGSAATASRGQFTRAFTGMINQLKVFVIAAVAAGGAMKIFNAGLEKQSAWTRFDFALKNRVKTVTEFNKASRLLRGGISSLSKTTGFDDEAIAEGVRATLVSKKTKDTSTIMRIARIATNFLAGTGKEGTPDEFKDVMGKITKGIMDPSKASRALRPFGVDFTADELKKLKGKPVAKGQDWILSRLEDRLGKNTAKDSLKTSLGAIRQFKTEFGNIMEVVGTTVINTLLPAMRQLTSAFSGAASSAEAGTGTLSIALTFLSKKIETLIGGAKMLADAFGGWLPLLGFIAARFFPVATAMAAATYGLQKLGETMGIARFPTEALTAAMGALMLVLKVNPFYAIAAAGIMVYQNWETVSQVFQDVWRWINLLFVMATGNTAIGFLADVGSKIASVWNTVADVFSKVVSILMRIGALMASINPISALGNLGASALSGIGSLLGGGVPAPTMKSNSSAASGPQASLKVEVTGPGKIVSAQSKGFNLKTGPTSLARS